MELISVKSSAIDNVGYEDNALYVKFKGDGWYKYPNVPKELFEKLACAESKGTFLNKVIKPKYRGFSCLAPDF